MTSRLRLAVLLLSFGVLMTVPPASTSLRACGPFCCSECGDDLLFCNAACDEEYNTPPQFPRTPQFEACMAGCYAMGEHCNSACCSTGC